MFEFNKKTQDENLLLKKISPGAFEKKVFFCQKKVLLLLNLGKNQE